MSFRNYPKSFRIWSLQTAVSSKFQGFWLKRSHLWEIVVQSWEIVWEISILTPIRKGISLSTNLTNSGPYPLISGHSTPFGSLPRTQDISDSQEFNPGFKNSVPLWLLAKGLWLLAEVRCEFQAGVSFWRRLVKSGPQQHQAVQKNLKAEEAELKGKIVQYRAVRATSIRPTPSGCSGGQQDTFSVPRDYVVTQRDQVSV